MTCCVDLLIDVEEDRDNDALLASVERRDVDSSSDEEEASGRKENGGSLSPVTMKPRAFSNPPTNVLSLPGANLVRRKVSQQKIRWKDGTVDLDLAYITPRIIAMGFPSHGTEAFYRNPIDEVEYFLESRHATNYRVYNLCSERQYHSSKRFRGNFGVYPFDDHHPPMPISLLSSFVDDAAAWLRKDEENVIAVHCKAGKSRTGTVISCLLMHLYRDEYPTADAALRAFAQRRTIDGNGVTIPSQRRYVAYFEKWLATASSSPSSAPAPARAHAHPRGPFFPRARQPVCLKKVTVFNLSSPAHPARSVFVKVKIADAVGKPLRTVFNTKSRWQPSTATASWDLSNHRGLGEGGIPLSGDVKLDFRDSGSLKDDRLFRICVNFDVIHHEELAFREQVAEKTPEARFSQLITLEYPKSDVDGAHKDRSHKKYPQDFRVEVVLCFPRQAGAADTTPLYESLTPAKSAQYLSVNGSTTGSPSTRRTPSPCSLKEGDLNGFAPVSHRGPEELSLTFVDPDGDRVKFFLRRKSSGFGDAPSRESAPSSSSCYSSPGSCTPSDAVYELAYSVNGSLRPVVTSIVFDEDQGDYLLFPEIQRGVHLPKRNRKEIVARVTSLATMASVDHNLPPVERVSVFSPDKTLLFEGPLPLRIPEFPVRFVGNYYFTFAAAGGSATISAAPLLTSAVVAADGLTIRSTPCAAQRLFVSVIQACAAIPPSATLSATILPDPAAPPAAKDRLHERRLVRDAAASAPKKGGFFHVTGKTLTKQRKWVVLSYTEFLLYSDAPPLGVRELSKRFGPAGQVSLRESTRGILIVDLMLAGGERFSLQPVFPAEADDWRGHLTKHAGWGSVTVSKDSLDDVVWELMSGGEVVASGFSCEDAKAKEAGGRIKPVLLSCCGRCQMNIMSLGSCLSIADALRDGVRIVPVVVGREGFDAVVSALLPFSATMAVERVSRESFADLVASPDFPSRFISEYRNQFVAVFAPTTVLTPQLLESIADRFDTMQPVFFALASPPEAARGFNSHPSNISLVPLPSPVLFDALATAVMQWYSHRDMVCAT